MGKKKSRTRVKNVALNRMKNLSGSEFSWKYKVETLYKIIIFRMEVFVVLSAVLTLAAATPGANSVDYPSVFRKIIANCLTGDDIVTCLSIKGITALNRAARSASIDLFPGVSFQRYTTHPK